MKICIIGGGAAGMMAAITASESCEVTILEHNSRPGKKILSTGNGRCNFTNKDMDISHFHGTDAPFITNVIKQFDYKKTINFFESIGVYPKDKNGYIYPYSEQASAVLDCLLLEIKNRNIRVITDCDVQEICLNEDSGLPGKGARQTQNAKDTHDTGRFRVVTGMGDYYFDRVIVTTGSYAAPKTGSDGSGFELIKPFKIEISKPLPALCSLKCKENFFKKIAGVRCSASVSIFVNDEFKKKDTGELQLTDYGISGIPVFQISYIAAKALNKKKRVTVEIDFLPELSDDDTLDLIAERIADNPGRTVRELLTGLFNNKLCDLFIMMLTDYYNYAGPGVSVSVLAVANTVCDDMSSFMANALVDIIKHFQTEITETNTFENAQVCTGGIKLTEVNATLECKKVPGLYFAGEILDVNGDCGGYNLQWAWSSGYVAGANAAQYIDI